jgi:DNA-binding MltR family transcriptional regulator
MLITKINPQRTIQFFFIHNHKLIKKIKKQTNKQMFKKNTHLLKIVVKKILVNKH